MLNISTKSTGRALIALTVALGLTVPTAAAEVPHHAAPVANFASPDPRALDTREAPPAWERYYSTLINNDAGEAAARIKARQDLRSPDTRDIAAGREYPPTPTVVTLKENPPVEQSSTGLDWFSAAAGAAAALGLILLMTATVVLVTRRRAHRDQPLAAT